MTMRNDKKKHINKHTFPNDIAEIIKPKPGMGPVFDSDSKPLMQRLKEARELIESGNLTEEERMILEETGEVTEETAEDELKDIRNGSFFDLERGNNFNDLLEAYKDEKRKF